MTQAGECSGTQALSRRDLSAEITTLIPRMCSVTYTPPVNSIVLGSTFVDWDSITAQATPVGQQRAVFDNPTPTLEKFESHITILLPGMMSNPVHRHP